MLVQCKKLDLVRKIRQGKGCNQQRTQKVLHSYAVNKAEKSQATQ